jgi:hypothetical protein
LPIKAFNRQARLGPFPLSLHRAVMVAAINGKRRPGARLPPFALLPACRCFRPATYYGEYPK